MILLGAHGRAKYTTGTRLGSSRDRAWNGLLAERWRHSEGDLGEVRVRDTEVIVLLRGRLRVRRRGDGRLQHCDAVPGTIWLCPDGVHEDMICLYGEAEESLHLFLSPSLLSATAFRELDVDPGTVSLHYDGGFLDPLIEQIARAIHAEMIDPTPAGTLLAESLAAVLGVQLLLRHSSLTQEWTPLPAARGALDGRRLQRVKDFIDAHLGADMTIALLANEACLSPFHFARAFKAATGTAPHRYLTERRIGYAKALIAEGRLPLAEIADMCGFSSQAHLARWFKRIVGATPGEYRANRK